jgi:anti-sigma B factor antagonist
MGEILSIRVRREPGHVLVTITGEIDISTAPQLDEQLITILPSGDRYLIVDLDQVSFIDAAGLGVLARAAKRATARGGTLHLVCARPRTRQLLAITGLDRRILLARTLAEAQATLPQDGGTPDSQQPPQGPQPLQDPS